MKRGTFRKQSISEIRQKQAKKRKKVQSIKSRRKTPENRKKVAKRSNLPSWLKAIPESQAHGSGTYQKRLWKVVSDYVRIRDWYKYGVCTATGTVIEHWSKGQAGHLKPYSNCNGLFKFDVRNIHLQSASSNKWGNYDTFRDFEKVVKNRGYNPRKFELDNRKASGERLYDSDVEEKIKEMLKLLGKLEEQPSYYQRAISLINKV